MTERYERLFSYGKRRPVSYHLQETWTDEVKALYDRLQRQDHSALAPLLKWDIEFLTDRRAIVSLILLKFAPELPDKYCRAELRRIANVISRRPGRRPRKLPHGDQLEDELEQLIGIIKERRLLEVKENLAAIQDRLEVAFYNPMLDSSNVGMGAQVDDFSGKEFLGDDEAQPLVLDRETLAAQRRVHGERKKEVATLAFALHEAVRLAPDRIKKPRTWALEAMADHYGVEAKQIEKSITREIRAARRRP